MVSMADLGDLVTRCQSLNDPRSDRSNYDLLEEYTKLIDFLREKVRKEKIDPQTKLTWKMILGEERPEELTIESLERYLLEKMEKEKQQQQEKIKQFPTPAQTLRENVNILAPMLLEGYTQQDEEEVTNVIAQMIQFQMHHATYPKDKNLGLFHPMYYRDGCSAFQEGDLGSLMYLPLAGAKDVYQVPFNPDSRAFLLIAFWLESNSPDFDSPDILRQLTIGQKLTVMTYSGRQYTVLNVKTEKILLMTALLGKIGAMPSMEDAFWQISSLMTRSMKLICGFIKAAKNGDDLRVMLNEEIGFSRKNGDDLNVMLNNRKIAFDVSPLNSGRFLNIKEQLKEIIEDQPAHTDPDHPVSKMSIVIKIEENLHQHALPKNIVFYFNLLKKMIQGLPDTHQTQMLPPILHEAYQKMLLELDARVSEMCHSWRHYEVFSIRTQMAFDRLISLLTLLKPHDSLPTLREEMFLFCKKAHEFEPQHVSLAPSGLAVLTHAMNESITQLREKMPMVPVGVELTEGVYFEIPIGLRTLIDRSNYPLKGRPRKFVLNPEQLGFDVKKNDPHDPDASITLTHLLITALHDNLDLKKNGHRSHNVSELIQEQIMLRKKTPGRENDPLIVIIDVSLSPFDDQRISDLLLEYEDLIRNGQLAILIGQSLNKSIHMGLDCCPSGLLAAYFNPEHFQILNACFPSEIVLKGFKIQDQTVQVFQHILLNAPYEIGAFMRMLKNSSSEIDLNFVPQELKDNADKSKQFLFVESAFTYDEEKEVWPFITIRFINLSINLMQQLPNLITNQIINNQIAMSRDGFSFINNAIISFSGASPALRIAIGLEPPELQKQKMQSLFDYLKRVNTTISEIMGAYLKDDAIINKEGIIAYLMDEGIINSVRKIPFKEVEHTQLSSAFWRENRGGKHTNPSDQDSSFQP